MCTGWRRLIGSPKLQIIFHKRAIKYRSLLRKMTYKDKGSYESSPPCTTLPHTSMCHTSMWGGVIHTCLKHMSTCHTSEWYVGSYKRWREKSRLAWHVLHDITRQSNGVIPICGFKHIDVYYLTHMWVQRHWCVLPYITRQWAYHTHTHRNIIPAYIHVDCCGVYGPAQLMVWPYITRQWPCILHTHTQIYIHTYV